jgi:predicted DNA-binding helix-hairpin-helix protein
VREHRLYQADWLIRHYGFTADEITATPTDNLPLDMDPKLAWALRNRHHFPVNLNTAPRETLLRVPGLGVRNVDRLLHLRRFQKIRLPHLLRLKIPLTRTRPFIITADHHPDTLLLDSPTLPAKLKTGRLSKSASPQLNLFETFQPALTGQL